MITLGLIDDHELVRAGIRRLLEENATIDVRWEAGDGRAGLLAFKGEPVDVVIVDFAMPGKDGLDTTREFRSLDQDVKLIVLTQHKGLDFVVRVRKAGAQAFLSKDASSNELVEAVLGVSAGRQFFPEALAQIPRGRGETLLDVLTDREFQVMVKLAAGMPNRELANELCISVKTVDSHRRRILAKLGLRNNADIARFAMGYRLLDS